MMKVIGIILVVVLVVAGGWFGYQAIFGENEEVAFADNDSWATQTWENSIKENVIHEDVIHEDIIQEDVIHEIVINEIQIAG